MINKQTPQYPITEITRAKFWNMLETMYPEDWNHLADDAIEYFAFPEPLGYSAEDEYMYYARIGHSYYSLTAASHNIRKRLKPVITQYAARLHKSV